MALQKSLSLASSDGGDAFSAALVESLFAHPEMAWLQTPTPSGGSENETLPLKPPLSFGSFFAALGFFSTGAFSAAGAFSVVGFFSAG
ncbi:hypothetical protein ACS0TY_024139 [Phlomoides rotata]